MSAPTLMSIPKEIRLNILKFAAENVWPELTVPSPTRPRASPREPVRTRFGFWGVPEGLDVSSSDPYEELHTNKESGLLLTCHTLREEFLEVLGATHELNLLPYTQVIYTCEYYEARCSAPDISVTTPPCYAACVQKIRRAVKLTDSDVQFQWLSHGASILDKFPRLKKVSLDSMCLSPDFLTERLGDRLWTVQELEKHAMEPALQARLSNVRDRIRREMKIRSEQHIVLHIKFTIGRFEACSNDDPNRFKDYILASSYPTVLLDLTS